MQYGLIEYVERRPVRTWTASEVSAGLTLVPVVEGEVVASSLNITIDGTSYPVVSVRSGETEDEPDLVELGVPLAAAVEEGTEVAPEPGVSEMVAGITIEDGTEMAEVVDVVVDSALQASLQLREGVREPLEREAVTFDMRSGDLYLIGVEGQVTLDGAAIDLSSLPSTPASDGIAPAESPDPQVIDGIGLVWVKLPLISNADPVMVDVHASKTSGFTPSESTLVAVAPNGGSLVIGTLDGVALEVNDVLYVRVHAHDADGYAPSPSTQRSGQVKQVGFEQVSQSIKDAITSAENNAIAAQLAVNGKNRNLYGPAVTTGTPPIPEGTIDGDRYFGREGLRTVQQWRYVAGAWVQEQIDGAVLANIDAGSITTGTLNVATLLEANTILAKIVAAEEITSEMVSSDVIVVGELFSQDGIHYTNPDTGAGFSMDENGFTQYGRDTAGELYERVRFPANPEEDNVVRGRMFIEWASAQRVAMYGTENILSRNARLLLSASLEAPGVPDVRVHYDKYTRSTTITPIMADATRILQPTIMSRSGDVLNIRAAVRGAAYNGYWAVRDLTLNLTTGVLTSASTGSILTDTLELPTTTTSVAFIGNKAYAISGTSLYKYDVPTRTREATWSRPVSGLAQGITAYNGQLWFWRQVSVSGETYTTVNWWTVNQSTGALTESTDFIRIHQPLGTVKQIVKGGTSSFGSNPVARNGVVTNSGTHFWVGDGFSTADERVALPSSLLGDHSLMYIPGTDPANPWVGGEWVSFGRFLSTNSPGAVRYTRNLVTITDAALSPFVFGTTWARDASRTYETQLSATVTMSVPRGCKIAVYIPEFPPVSDPPAPTDVDRAFVYYKPTISTGVWKRPGAILRGTAGAVIATIVSTTTGSEPPPSTSTFPPTVGNPAVIASASGGLALYGNGDAKRAKPVGSDPDDIANKAYVDGTDTSWTTLTPQNSWAHDTGGYGAIQAKLIGGMVVLRGMVRNGTADATMATLPVGLRPPKAILTTAITNLKTTGAASTGTAHTHNISNMPVRLDITTGGLISTTGATSTTTWVSLDGVAFPVS